MCADFRDVALPIESRIDALLEQMTLAEKIGQMTQVEKNSITPEDVTAYSIGSILSGGGGNPTPNTPETWLRMVRRFQEAALQSRLGIPLIYGSDGVHGHSNVKGAVIFPHNIGLGAADDEDLVERVAQITASELLATGVHWNFAPAVSVPQDIRWGRTYEGFGENTDLVTRLGAAYVRGLQNGAGKSGINVLASVKHYVGDGGTAFGSTVAGWSVHGATGGSIENRETWIIDQGVTAVEEDVLRRIHLPPYRVAIEAGALNIMVSYSSWNGLKMHAQKYLLTDVLKQELGFTGFLVSDWLAIYQLSDDPYSCVVESINAGLDMVMVPYDYKAFIAGLTQAVEKGDVPVERIDDAVRRILIAKYALGVFDNPYTEDALISEVGSERHRAVARESVRKSLVLLKNDAELLPLSKDNPLLLVAGEAADNIGLQCGGWTIEWQGQPGDITPGTTLLQGLKAAVSGQTRVLYDAVGQFEEGTPMAGIGIAVVGERPYAEGEGDRRELALTDVDVAAIENLRARCNKVILVLISGRPLIITEQIEKCDAVVAAWLPGSEGQGMADVLFGDFPFTGKLPFSWPRSMDQIPLQTLLEHNEEPLFPYGYGLIHERNDQ